MKRAELVWKIARPTMGNLTRMVAPLKVYGADRMPPDGGLVLALNHFSWIDPPAFGEASPRTIYYMAKAEIHRIPGLGHMVRSFGAFAVRRGESDREAVRRMREVVREGHALGLFAEGTRQRSGSPGQIQPGAAMAALQEDVPVVPAAIHGSFDWAVGNFRPVSVAWGEPLRFDGLPKGAKGYREASAEIQQRIHALHDWLIEIHALGRPRRAIPPR